MRCPTCGKVVKSREAPPFCSKVCRRLDLGRWLDGSYRIAGEPADPESLVDDPDVDNGGIDSWDA